MMSAAFRLPAEWEPQAGVLLAWPHAQTDWAERLADVESTYVALVAAIARFEPVIICVADAAVARACDGAARLPHRSIAANADLSKSNTTTRGCATPARFHCVDAGRFLLN